MGLSHNRRAYRAKAVNLPSGARLGLGLALVSALGFGLRRALTSVGSTPGQAHTSRDDPGEARYEKLERANEQILEDIRKLKAAANSAAAPSVPVSKDIPRPNGSKEDTPRPVKVDAWVEADDFNSWGNCECSGIRTGASSSLTKKAAEEGGEEEEEAAPLVFGVAARLCAGSAAVALVAAALMLQSRLDDIAETFLPRVESEPPLSQLVAYKVELETYPIFSMFQKTALVPMRLSVHPPTLSSSRKATPPIRPVIQTSIHYLTTK